MNRPRQVCAMVIALCSLVAVARGGFSFNPENSITSISGQFVVSSLPDEAPVFRDPALLSDTNAVHLDPTFLAVAAERFKLSLRRQLGIAPDASWSGKIFLRLHTARSLDETVTITASPFLNYWNYSVDLPDVVTRTRYARALTAVVLLEYANRAANPAAEAPGSVHAAELPDWLVDGLAQQVLATEGEKVILSAPSAKGDELAVRRINLSQRGINPLADARAVLQSLPVLTFDQLSWPTDAQMEGADGSAYLASAQVFQSELLGLKNGREKVCAMLAGLPGCFNWQTAFYHAFNDDFQNALDVEKWWALRVVNFAAVTSGPRWTVDVSLARMDELLSVPVDFRSASNALPSHADISLQDAMQNMSPEDRDMILRIKVRDLGLAEFRLAAPFGELADGYRVALSDFLGEARFSWAPPGGGNIPQLHWSPLQAQTGKGAPMGGKPALRARSAPVLRNNSMRGADRLLTSAPLRETGAGSAPGKQAETPGTNRRIVTPSNQANIDETLKKLDELDAQRRNAETKAMTLLQQASLLNVP